MSENFAGRLRELRTEARFSQKELAERAGLTKDGIAQLEQGRRSPSWETVLALCEALGASCEAFRIAPKETPAPERGRPRKAASEEETKASASMDKPLTTSKRKTQRKGK